MSDDVQFYIEVSEDLLDRLISIDPSGEIDQIIEWLVDGHFQREAERKA